MRVDFDLTSAQPSENKAKQFSDELSRNVYFGYSETSKRIGAHDFPGLKVVSNGSEIDRGDHVMANVRYILQGNTLFSEDVDGNRTNLGSIPGSDRAVFADDGTNLFVVCNGNIYHYNGSTISTVSQSAVVNPSTIAFINSTFIITGDDGEFGVSDVGDGTTYQANNSAKEETAPDGLTRVYVFTQLIYMFGERTTVPYVLIDSGNPPVQRQETSLANVGIAGKYAVSNSDSYLYWLGDDRKVYQGVGATARPIQTLGISKILDSISDVSDCIVSSFVHLGMNFVLFKLPTGNAALLYNESNNTWTELNSGTNKDSREEWYGNSVTRCYNKNLVTDYRSGNTYELDKDTYTDNLQTRLRVVVPRSFTCRDIGVQGRRILATQMNIECQTGVGLTTGQGSNPVLMCQFSIDGGHTWQGEEFVEIGVLGDHTKRVDFWDFANGYEIKPRIMISDPVYFSMYGGFIELIDGGF